MLKFIFSFLIYITISLHAIQFNQTVQAAQIKLTELGYNPGKIDGLWGKNTQAAVKEYQNSKGLEATGKLDKTTLKSLNIESYQNKQYNWLPANNKTVENIKKIIPPNGYKRINSPEQSFSNWLRGLPIRKKDSTVYLYNGAKKINQSAQYAVIDIDTGTKDLQQCADAVIRLRAEYLYAAKKYEDINFKFTSGDQASYTKWRSGYRPVINGNKVIWSNKATYDNSYENFRKYLDTVFMYAGSYSLSKELFSKDISLIQVGDVFITGGFPGHAVIVVDVAENLTTGEKVFMLAQSYMPAQDIHILKNPASSTLSPWYKVKPGQKIVTPEWTFSDKHLRKF